MSHFSDYPTEFNAIFEGRITCSRMVMSYIDGGAQELYRAWITPANGAPAIVEVTVPGGASKAQLFDAIAKAAP
jgi:hypothetical protein